MRRIHEGSGTYRMAVAVKIEWKMRAADGNRTHDLCLTKASLYPLATAACVIRPYPNLIHKGLVPSNGHMGYAGPHLSSLSISMVMAAQSLAISSMNSS